MGFRHASRARAQESQKEVSGNKRPAAAAGPQARGVSLHGTERSCLPVGLSQSVPSCGA